MKILNINAVAKHLTKNYSGPLVEPDSPTLQLQCVYRKNKQLLATDLINSTRNLFGSPEFVRAAVNTGMGFVIGQLCVLTIRQYSHHSLV